VYLLPLIVWCGSVRLLATGSAVSSIGGRLIEVMHKRKWETANKKGKKKDDAYHRFVQLVGSSTTSIVETQATFGVTRGEAWYYQQKVAAPTSFHPNSHGGK